MIKRGGSGKMQGVEKKMRGELLKAHPLKTPRIKTRSLLSRGQQVMS